MRRFANRHKGGNWNFPPSYGLYVIIKKMFIFLLMLNIYFCNFPTKEKGEFTYTHQKMQKDLCYVELKTLSSITTVDVPVSQENDLRKLGF